jgi:hypothetical protein
MVRCRLHAGVHGDDFVVKSPTVVAYLKAWPVVAADFKNNPNKVVTIYSFFTSKGYMSREP